VLALGLMSQPTTPLPTRTSDSAHPSSAHLSKAALAPETPAPPPDSAGPDVALNVLEATLIGGEVSPQTNQLIHKQISDIPTTNSIDTLNLLTALVMGSPEF